MSIPGTSFEEGNVSGGFCIKSLAQDHMQVSSCAPFGTDAALTISFTSIFYLGDDSRGEFVPIYLRH